MLSLTNNLTAISEEIAWSRNTLLSNLHEIEKTLNELEAEDLLKAKEKLSKVAKESLLILEDIDYDDVLSIELESERTAHHAEEKAT